MAKYTLYGDGIHDDTLAIQEMIDSAKYELTLPVPEKNYLISKPLELPSDFCFILPRFAEIKLKKGSDCIMLKNKTKEDLADRGGKRLWCYLNTFSPDYYCQNIEVRGGIWNFNNKEQRENPVISKTSDFSNNYNGMGMLFFGVNGLRIADLTLKDPITFGATLDKVSYFTVENIVFDFNDGNPLPTNMDGIHINGNCHHGFIRNLKGACYDDLVAINADEGTNGPITDIEIDGLYAVGCHSAVRLLTVKNRVANIHIRNVFGTYYQYCVGFTKYYPGELTGCFDAISLDHIYASKAKRLPKQEEHMGGGKTKHFPLIWLQDETYTKNITIDTVHRCEYCNPIETIYVGKQATVENLVIKNVTVENHTDAPISKFVNYGTVKKLFTEGLSDEEIENYGTISAQ